jgi:hypothetical protein
VVKDPGAAVGPGDELLIGQLGQVAPGGGRGDLERVDQLDEADGPPLVDQVEDRGQPLGALAGRHRGQHRGGDGHGHDLLLGTSRPRSARPE